MQLNDMAVIETTYEAVRGEYIYRVSVAADYIFIKRARAEDRPLWFHGVLTEGYDRDAQAFLPMLKTTNLRLTPAAAEAVLASL